MFKLKKQSDADMINSILEGCNNNDNDPPSRIQYAGFEFKIPENVKIVSIRDEKLLLYFPQNQRQNYTEHIAGGWPLRDSNVPNPDWVGQIFSMPRSLTTKDGRMYLSSIFFKPKWEYYFKIAISVVHDCFDVFSGRKTIDDIDRLCRRAF